MFVISPDGILNVSSPSSFKNSIEIKSNGVERNPTPFCSFPLKSSVKGIPNRWTVLTKSCDNSLT